MTNSLEEISQITIYFKDSDHLSERVNEIALFQPLAKKATFEKEAKPLQQRKWNFYHKLPLHRRLFVKVQSFFFHRFKKIIPPERRTPEAQFKTAVAILLAQEGLREFFLGSTSRRQRFLKDLQDAAQEWGFLNLSLPQILLFTPLEISRQLTTLPGKQNSLLDDPIELNLQIATLPLELRNEILFIILNRTERPPLQSILEIAHADVQRNVSILTKYAKTKVHKWNPSSEEISYSYTEDEATSSIRTTNNIRPGIKGVMNQRAVFDVSESPRLIGTYSGELSTTENVLEELFFMLNCSHLPQSAVKKKEKTVRRAFLYSTSPTPTTAPTSLLFISLYSWNEWGLLLAQHRSLETIDQKYLLFKNTHDQEVSYKLQLMHVNIPFNAFNKYPAPSEIEARMEDFRDECLMVLTSHALSFFKRSAPSSFEDALSLFESSKKEWEFSKREKERIDAVDLFRLSKTKLVDLVKDFLNGPQNQAILAHALTALLLKKTHEGKLLNGMDEYLFFRLVADQLSIRVNINCQNSTDRSAGANAADKAQNAFEKCVGKPFLPGVSIENEKELFKVFYSMYLVWEEPELTAALSTGFMGEKFFKNFFQKNPETTRYLIRWLQKHPEIYLGLSDFR